jgi:hypothetical protein
MLGQIGEIQEFSGVRCAGRSGCDGNEYGYEGADQSQMRLNAGVQFYLRLFCAWVLISAQVKGALAPLVHPARALLIRGAQELA